MILAGDVGGTKALLALCDDTGAVTREMVFHCHEASSLEAWKACTSWAICIS